MTSNPFRSALVAALVAAFAGVADGAQDAGTRTLHLRNEKILTPRQSASAPPASTPGPRQLESVVSGLFLLQFTGPVDDAWSAPLRDAGIELLTYVPDDGFIVRARNARLDAVRQLPFVHWVGEYRLPHKVHTDLRPGGRARLPGRPIEVSVLLAPDAPATARVEASRQFQSVAPPSVTRLGTILRGTVSADSLTRLTVSDQVIWIERAPKMRLFDEVSTKIVAGPGSGGHLATVHELGYDGSGVTVSVADSGLDSGDLDFMHPDIEGRVAALFYYGTLSDAADEHSHGTHCAGIIAGNGITGEVDELNYRFGLGVAPGSRLVGQRMFDAAGGYEPPPTFETLTRDATQAGAVIGSNSWGDDTHGQYDLSAAEFDALVRDADALTPGDQPYILEFSAGNAGPGIQTIGSPAVGKNVIATGASQSDRIDFFIYADGPDAMADFSSRGPCEDGRVKPDIVAPGTWIASLRSVFANDENAWAPISDRYLYQGGTSQAGPHASGAAAVFVQYYRETHTNRTPSPALVKAALINSATDMDDEIETGPVPNPDEGWGRIDLPGLIASDRVHQFIDQSTLLRTGQQFEHRVVVGDSEQPLWITLAYTDVPALPAALPALVNDLDLEVVAPDGRTYYGNQFFEGESVPDVAVADSINNVENIFISDPMPGEYIVRIRGRNVPQDARLDTVAKDQDFAVVVSGSIPPPGRGVLLFDRTAYTAPGRIQLRVIDTDLAGQPSVTVPLTSTLQTTPLAVTLRPTGVPGTFTGSVATAIGPVTADGRLHIAHGNTISASYTDAVPALVITATAAADLVPPVISGVTVINQYGQSVVQWLTDEPATSVVRYSTNTPPSLVISNTLLVAEHEVALTNIVPTRTYRYLVVSSDAAGNTATNNNSGAFHSFTAPATATVLLVNDFPENFEDPPLPLSNYTNALAATGVRFDVWPVVRGAQRVYPTLANLRPYPIVMWRINDSITLESRPTIPAAQQTALQQYLGAGGAFFMASMEICSLLGNVPFRSNVLQVAEFSPNPDPFSPCDDCDEDHTVPSVTGAGGDPITAGMNVALDYSSFPEVDFIFLIIGPDVSDTFRPRTNATAIAFDAASGRPCGVRYPRTGSDSTGRVVFLSFPLEAIPESGSGPNSRAGFLRNVLQFLAPSTATEAVVSLDRDQYNAPDLVQVEVTDADLAGTNNTVIRFRSTLDPVGVTAPLQATPVEGLYRATMLLGRATNAPSSTRLRVNHNDTLTAEYFDASRLLTVSGTATIDLVTPVIADVVITADYEDAVVTWTTSEPADATVQFGESTFLGRTAYDPEMTTEHELQLQGLQPNQTYYVRVVSRDAAGNVARDDRGGRFYTFRTKKPLVTPYFEDFDAGANGWTVFDAEESFGSWQLGVPNNDLQTSAASPPNAWGSVLNGNSADQIETYLISPAIVLAEGNVATLTFEHCYDFLERTPLDLLETGELLLFTNANTAPITLATYDDYDLAWTTETINLTPYIGRTIYLAFHYALLSFEPEIRAGWLIDNVSVDVVSIAPGNIRITNNVFQSSFAVTGPVNRNGTGRHLLITGAPPGEYLVTFNSVPNYQTPPAQTLTLPPGGTVVATGDYTFTDANLNGLPDSWEQQYLGGLVEGNPATRDTDHDGASDLAEFTAGTLPANPASFLALRIREMAPDGTVQCEWSATPGRGYRVWSAPDLLNWTPATDWVRAPGGVISVAVPPAAGAPRRFYKLEVSP